MFYHTGPSSLVFKIVCRTKLSRIAIFRDECRRMNCRLNWSFISCGELHCDSVKIKTMINSSLFFLRQCGSLDWSDWLFCYCRLLISGRAVTRVWIRGCFSFSQCFRKGVFSSLSPPPPRSLWLAPFPPLFGKFQHGALKENACTAGYHMVTRWPIKHINYCTFASKASH